MPADAHDKCIKKESVGWNLGPGFALLDRTCVVVETRVTV
jgi:hypothetical protein